MKLFCQIFAVYFLALACIPCSDGEHGHDQNLGKNVVQVIESSGQNGLPGHEHCADLCSPLCSCNCCSSLFVFQKAVVFSVSKNLIFPEKQPFSTLDFLVKDMAFAIDHPPQLG